MKFNNIIYCIGFLFILLVFTIASAENNSIVDTPTQKQASSIKENKYTTLGFKGIHLGMTREEVKEVVTSDNGLYFKYDNDVSGDYVFLKSESPIGCKGQGETEECYSIDSVTLHFFEERVIQISLDSPEYSADKIDHNVKEWASFGLQILKNKFGNPSKTNLRIDRVNIFSFESGYSIPLYEWKKKSETVKLSIGSYEFKYYAKIQYVNEEAYSKIKKEKRKIKSGL